VIFIKRRSYQDYYAPRTKINKTYNLMIVAGSTFLVEKSVCIVD